MTPVFRGLFASFEVTEILKEASLIELFVLLTLLLASVASWALIALKARQLSAARRQSVAFLGAFWQSTRLEAIYQQAQTLDASPLSRVFRAGFEELSRLSQARDQKEGAMSERLGGIENVERALQRASTSEITSLEATVPFLGTVGATSPFIGLFGTVVGILSAFQEIAAAGKADLATVTAPIGNALFATAAGLFAAIPAVIAYNHFVSRIRIFDTEMSNFSADFLNIVKRHFFK